MCGVRAIARALLLLAEVAVARSPTCARSFLLAGAPTTALRCIADPSMLATEATVTRATALALARLLALA